MNELRLRGKCDGETVRSGGCRSSISISSCCLSEQQQQRLRLFGSCFSRLNAVHRMLLLLFISFPSSSHIEKDWVGVQDPPRYPRLRGKGRKAWGAGTAAAKEHQHQQLLLPSSTCVCLFSDLNSAIYCWWLMADGWWLMADGWWRASKGREEREKEVRTYYLELTSITHFFYL